MSVGWKRAEPPSAGIGPIQETGCRIQEEIFRIVGRLNLPDYLNFG